MTLEVPALFMLPHLTTLAFSTSFVLPFLSHKSPGSGSSLFIVHLTHADLHSTLSGNMLSSPYQTKEYYSNFFFSLSEICYAVLWSIPHNDHCVHGNALSSHCPVEFTGREKGNVKRQRLEGGRLKLQPCLNRVAPLYRFLAPWGQTHLICSARICSASFITTAQRCRDIDRYLQRLKENLPWSMS